MLDNGLNKLILIINQGSLDIQNDAMNSLVTMCESTNIDNFFLNKDKYELF